MSDAKPSKSARKREVAALQALGEQLISLKPQQLASIDMDSRLLDEVLEAQKMQSHGALRRQKQLIGKLMRGVDPDPIRKAIDAFGQKDRQSQEAFRRAEHWRDKIVESGASEIERFSAELGRDCAELPALLDRLQTATDGRRRKHAGKQLFREVHRLIRSEMQKDTI